MEGKGENLYLTHVQKYDFKPVNLLQITRTILFYKNVVIADQKSYYTYSNIKILHLVKLNGSMCFTFSLYSSIVLFRPSS